MGSPTQFRSVSSLSSERILTLPPAHDRTSLSSFGGEGWGEEAALSESHCRPGLQTRRCPSPQPSPRARLAGRGRNLWWQCQERPVLGRHTLRKNAVSGLVLLAVSWDGARPHSNAARPASTAHLKASAIRFGSLATAMAVLTSTASAPISIASAA